MTSVGTGNMGQTLMTQLILLIRCTTFVRGLTVYVNEGLPFAWYLSVKNSADSYLCFRLALLPSFSHFLVLYRSPSLPLYTVFDSISSKIDDILSINPSANVLVFGDFNVQCPS